MSGVAAFRFAVSSLRTRISPISAARSISVSASLKNWNKDFKPDPYPKTEEEWAAAAKKYGLRREDYEPYPDDGLGFGDYPKLQPMTGTLRDPYHDWDEPYLMRNYGEPMHAYADVYNEERLDVSEEPPYPYWVLFASFFGMIGVFIVSYMILDFFPQTHPVMPKQYPFTADGQRIRGKHFTFELDDS